MFKVQVEILKQTRRRNVDASDAFFQIRRTGRKLEVADAFRQVVDFDPSWIEAHYQYGLSLHRLGRNKDAIPHFQICASTHPEWVSAINHLGLCHLRSGNVFLGLSILKTIFELDPDSDISGYAKAFEIFSDEYFKLARKEKNKEFRDGIINELQRICDEDVVRNGERPWSSLYLGAIQFYKNNVDDSLSYFEKASELSDPYNANYPIVHKTAYGCFTVKKLDTTKKIIARSELAGESIVFGQSCNTDLVFLLGCDEGYFRRFSEFLISSIAKSNKRLTVHFHIIGDRDNIEAEIVRVDSIAKSAEGIEARYSFEKKPDDATVTYYAISRFLVAHKIIKHYSADVIIGDIDSAVIGDLREVKRYVAESDIGVNTATNPDSFRKFPWNSISGGYMFFKNSKLGVAYAESLSKYMCEVYDPRSLKSWWLDQSSLFCVTQYFVKNELSFKLKSFVNASAPQPFLNNPAGQSKDDFARSVMDMLSSGEFDRRYVLERI
jgi:tetratricopeptide (TPR) repeat protein